MFEKLSLEALVEELTTLCKRAEQLCEEIDIRLARLDADEASKLPASESRRTLIFPSERGPADRRGSRGSDE